MNNISGVRSCYGCGVCGLACGQKIIEIRLNREGFYEPYIADETCCTDCGICTDVCAYLHEDLSSKDHIVLQSYAAWSKDVQIRHKCSSGGVGFELGRYLLGKGYQVCGVRYNPDLNRAEHYMASCVEELTPSVGSKYIQSFTLDGFRRINRKDKMFEAVYEQDRHHGKAAQSIHRVDTGFFCFKHNDRYFVFFGVKVAFNRQPGQ